VEVGVEVMVEPEREMAEAKEVDKEGVEAAMEEAR